MNYRDTLLDWISEDDEEDYINEHYNSPYQVEQNGVGPIFSTSSLSSSSPPISPTFDHVKHDHVKTVFVTAELLDESPDISATVYSRKLTLLSTLVRDLKRDRDLYHQVAQIDKRKIDELQIELSKITKCKGNEQIYDESSTKQHFDISGRMIQIAKDWREEEIILQERLKVRLEKNAIANQLSSLSNHLINSQKELIQLTMASTAQRINNEMLIQYHKNRGLERMERKNHVRTLIKCFAKWSLHIGREKKYRSIINRFCQRRRYSIIKMLLLAWKRYTKYQIICCFGFLKTITSVFEKRKQNIVLRAMYKMKSFCEKERAQSKINILCQKLMHTQRISVLNLTKSNCINATRKIFRQWHNYLSSKNKKCIQIRRVLLSSKRRLQRLGYKQFIINYSHKMDLEKAEDDKADLREMNCELQNENERAVREVQTIAIELNHVEELYFQEKRSNLEQREHIHARQMRRIILRVRKRLTCMAYQQWVDFVSNRKQIRTFMHKLTNHLLYKSFQTWFDNKRCPNQ